MTIENASTPAERHAAATEAQALRVLGFPFPADQRDAEADRVAVEAVPQPRQFVNTPRVRTDYEKFVDDFNARHGRKVVTRSHHHGDIE